MKINKNDRASGGVGRRGVIFPVAFPGGTHIIGERSFVNIYRVLVGLPF